MARVNFQLELMPVVRQRLRRKWSELAGRLSQESFDLPRKPATH